MQNFALAAFTYPHFWHVFPIEEDPGGGGGGATAGVAEPEDNEGDCCGLAAEEIGRGACVDEPGIFFRSITSPTA